MGEVKEFGAGWSVSRLASEFQMDRKTVAKRIREAGVQPSGVLNGYDVYRMSTVAPYLCDAPVAGGQGAVVDPRDLPPMERRAFYQSENERLSVEQKLGTLVPAAEVEADYADLVKLMVQFLDTLPDVLERDCSLAPDQVMRVMDACDRIRMEMFKRVTSDDETGDVRDGT